MSGLDDERERLQIYADRLSVAEKEWLGALEASRRIGWRVHLFGNCGNREVRVFPPPTETDP